MLVSCTYTKALTRARAQHGLPAPDHTEAVMLGGKGAPEGGPRYTGVENSTQKDSIETRTIFRSSNAVTKEMKLDRNTY